MLSVKTLARPFRYVPLALVVAAIAVPPAQAFFSADDLARLTDDCVPNTLAAAGAAAAPAAQPKSTAPCGVDWGDAGIGVGVGVAGSLGLGAAALFASRRRGRLVHA